MDESIIRDRYSKLSPTYECLASEVEDALRAGLAERGLKISAILRRAKTIDSVIEKSARKRFEDPFGQNEDFAGVRVVCLFTPDLARVDTVIKETFELKRVENKSEALDVDRMGYEGAHYVVAVPSRWGGHRYDRLKGLLCEIQVRTICQDAWAQISHHLDYAAGDSLPPPVRRELFRTAALLETAQQLFDNVNGKRSEYSYQVSAKSRYSVDEFLSQPIDSETLKAYSGWKFPKLTVKENVLQWVLRDIELDRYKSLRDLDNVVEQAKSFNESYQSVRPDLYTSGLDFITKGLGFLDLGFRSKHPFGIETKKRFARLKPASDGSAGA